MELSGLTLDIAALPWPGFVLVTILLFFIVWYFVFFKKLSEDYEKLKEEHHNETRKILDQLDKIQEKIIVFENEIGRMRNDLNNIANLMRDANLANSNILSEMQTVLLDRISTLEDGLSDNFCDKLESVKNDIQNIYLLRHRD